MRVVGLLRGVNLGGRQLKMADLRAVVTSLGHGDVETYLQSGNVVFTPATGAAADADALGGALSAALHDAVGMEVGVLIRTGAAMAALVAANPYQRDDPTKVVVTFLERAADAAPINGMDLRSFAPEGLTVRGTEIYLDLPFGQARSTLLGALAKRKVYGAKGTSRNWRTVEAVAGMAAGR